MRIFMLIKWLDNSGAPKMFVWLANNLADHGHDVTVFTYLDNEGNINTLSDKVHHIHDSLNNVGLLGKIKKIRKFIKAMKPDISISFLLDANVYNMFSCYGLKTKSVICERNDPFKPHYYKLKFWKPWFRMADGAVFQLPKVAEYYNTIKGKTAVIPNPVPPMELKVNRKFEERDDEIVTVGRIDVFQKRQDVLIKAFAKFQKDHLSYRLIIYGGGQDNDISKIKRLIKQLNIEGSVILAGAVSNPTERILNAKMFVLSSDFEGIPNALIEAMSAGLPCISTDCRPGGAGLLIDDGKNGMIVPAGDSAALAEKMSCLAANPVTADNMGLSAMKIIERFSGDIILEMWIDYLELLTKE